MRCLYCNKCKLYSKESRTCNKDNGFLGTKRANCWKENKERKEHLK